MPPFRPAPRYTLDAVEDKVKVLYYGDQGSGKTTDVATLAKGGKTVIINAEGGVKRRPLVDLGIPVGNIELHNAITFDALDALFWDIKGKLEDDPDAFYGCAWDSLTEGHQMLLGLTRERSVQKTRDSGKERDLFDTYVDDYGVNTGEMRHLCRQFRDLPIHIAWTALPRRDQDDDGTVQYGPELTPKLAESVLGFVDIVCHTQAVPVYGEPEPQYWGSFRASGKFRAKDRFHAVPPRLVNPTMERIIKYVSGDLTVEDDEEQQEALTALDASKVAESNARPARPQPKLAKPVTAN